MNDEQNQSGDSPVTQPKPETANPTNNNVDAINPTADETSPEITNQVTPNKPARKPKKILLILLITVLLIGAGIGLALFITDDDDTDTPQNDINASTTQVQDDTPASTFNPAIHIPELHQQLLATYADTVNASSPGDYDGAPGSVVFYSQPDDFLVSITADENSYSFTSYDQSTDVVSPYQDAIDFLKEKGLEEETVAGVLADYYSSLDDPFTRLANDSYTCNVAQFSTDRLNIDCVANSSLPDAASEIKPFYDSYQAEFPDDSDSTSVISIQTISDTTAFPGYMIAAGGIGNGDSGAFIKFYKKADGGEWMYGYGGHAAPECTEVSEVDGQKAFASETCYDDTTAAESTFAEYYNL